MVFGKISMTQKCFKMFEICVEIINTSLYINVKWENYFCGFFRRFMGIFRIKKNMFFCPRFWLPALAVDRNGRPGQEPVDRSGRPDVHKIVHVAVSVGRSTDRSTDCEQPTLGLLPVDRAVDWQRVLLSVSGAGRPGGRPVAANGQKLTVVRSTVRSTGRPFLAVLAANGYIFLGAINTPLVASFL